MLLGNVSVRSSQNGNIVLIVDSSVVTPPDGAPDLIIRFAPKKHRAEYQNVAFDLEGARIIFGDRRVAVIGSDGHTWVSLSLEPVRRGDPGFGVYGNAGTDVPQTVRLSRGYALQRQSVNRFDDGSIPPINIDQTISVRTQRKGFRIQDGDFELEHSCDAGGRGATACSYSCGGQSCSVTCSAGMYACCFCNNSIPFCQCRLN